LAPRGRHRYLPFLARPLSAEERMRALALARRYGMDALEEALPISIPGADGPPRATRPAALRSGAVRNGVS
jgi:hypothetical protein